MAGRWRRKGAGGGGAPAKAAKVGAAAAAAAGGVQSAPAFTFERMQSPRYGKRGAARPTLPHLTAATSSGRPRALAAWDKGSLEWSREQRIGKGVEMHEMFFLLVLFSLIVIFFFLFFFCVYLGQLTSRHH